MMAVQNTESREVLHMNKDHVFTKNMITENAGTQMDPLTEKIKHQTEGRPFSIHHTNVEKGNKNALYIHCHSELEFFYLKEGELDFYIESNVYHIQTGDAILIPGGLIHYARCASNGGTTCSFDAVVFSIRMMIDALPSYCGKYFDSAICNSMTGVCCLTPDTDWQNAVIDFLTGIFDYDHTSIDKCELIIRGRLLSAWQLLYNNRYSTRIAKHYARPIYPLLNKCIDTINSNYMYDFSLADLAAASGLSKGHFCRVFKDVTGFTPFGYLNRVRIAKACGMLTGTDKKIADISARCGFNNISYFNRAFKQIMKKNPSEYRKNFQSIT